MSNSVSRRGFLQQTLCGPVLAGAATAGVTLAASATSGRAADPSPEEPFRFSFNTSTIRGQQLPIVQEVEIAAKAGYHAFEPWINELERYVKEGGDLKDLAKRIRDAGLSVESSIGFAQWIVEDDTARKQGLEQARRDMDLVQRIGGKRIAAPPTGATDKNDPHLLQIAERYRALLDIGQQIGVTPQVEVWGFSKTLNKLGEVALVAVESGHPQACLLADVYHLHKGGSGFVGLKQLGPSALQIFHMNDYPAKPDRVSITDAHRVYPGDGVAPLVPMLRDLRALGFRGHLSLELFNREYWKQDPLQVAKTGLEKMKAVVKRALAPEN
jgi:2-keto-myo-inositol isomerase